MGGGAQILSNLANLSNVESVFRQRKWRFLETTLLHPKCLKACYHAPSLAWDQSKLGWLIYSLCALLFDDDAVKSAGKTRNHEGSFITVKPFLVSLEIPGPLLTLQKSFISAGETCQFIVKTTNTFERSWSGWRRPRPCWKLEGLRSAPASALQLNVTTTGPVRSWIGMSSTCPGVVLHCW